MPSKQIVRTIQKFILEMLSTKDQLERSTLVEETIRKYPNFNRNTVQSAIAGLTKDKKIFQQERGLWTLAIEPSKIVDEEKATKIPLSNEEKNEEKFYQPFADWLVNETGECNHVAVLGGKVLKDKWGTPDVIGYYREEDNARYRQNEITSFVSAEIKINPNSPVEAFGQACAYLLFSHKVYLVLPDSISDSDKVRSEKLCSIVGLGLVLFNPKDHNFPDFKIRQRPILREPDATNLNKKILMNNEIYNRLKRLE